MPEQLLTNIREEIQRDLTGVIDRLISSDDVDQLLDAGLKQDIMDKVAGIYESAYSQNNEEDRKVFHSILYKLCISRLHLPWEKNIAGIDHLFLFSLRKEMERLWEQGIVSRYSSILNDLPPDESFSEWITEFIQSHSSNVVHPLFAYLKNEATLEQLKQFFYQETPFDMFFADLLAMMLPGIYGSMKTEMCHNFWDEVGRGKEEKVHRQLRIDFMNYLALPLTDHIDQVEKFCWEELALANSYFIPAFDRSRLAQLMGMMLATETMVPGRLDHQIDGWRRVGIPDEAMVYLIEHTVVDVEHSIGWMNNVVLPMIEQDQQAKKEIVIGVLRRLEAAGDVCDKMYRYLPAV